MTAEERECIEKDMEFRFKNTENSVRAVLHYLTDKELSALSKRTSFVDGVARESGVTFAEPF